jgi:signal recognition particle receptor subunit beta
MSTHKPTMKPPQPSIDMSALFNQPYVLGGIIATFMFFVFIIVYFFRRRSRGPRDNVLLIGLSDSGKTVMFSRLVTGVAASTVTSMTENVCANVVVCDTSDKDRTVTLVDVPGADRVRKPRLQHWFTSDDKNSIIGVIICVDSSTFTRQQRDVAELVYDTLVDAPNRIRILVVANKHDLQTAKSANLIRTALAKEMALLNKTRAASLSMTDGSDKNSSRLLKMADNADTFDFDSLGKRLSFVECRRAEEQNESKKEDAQSNSDDSDVEPVEDDGLDAVRDWLVSL